MKNEIFITMIVCLLLTSAGFAIDLPITAGLIARFDGDNVQIDPQNPGYVKVWTDQSGQGNDANDVSGGLRQPFLLENELAGHAVLDMARLANNNDDGYYNSLVIPKGNTDFETTNLTWFIVYKPSENTLTWDPVMISTQYTSPDATPGFWRTYISAGRVITNARNELGDPIADIGLTGVAVKGWNLACGVWDSSGTNTENGDIDQYLNGNRSDTQENSAETSTAVSGHLGTVIGSSLGYDAVDGYGYGSFFDGQVAEVLIYNYSMTKSEIDQVGSYLANKYGLNTAYPATTCAGLWGKGLGIQIDTNQDCEINIDDLGDLAMNWVHCYHPDDPGCTQ